AGPRAPAGEAGPVAQDRPAHELRPRTRAEQRDVRADAAADESHGAEPLERRVDVAHQDLRGVAAAVRHAGVAVAGEVEREHGGGPGGELAGHARGRALAEAVQEQELRSAAAAQLVERELDPVVPQLHARNSRTRSATRCGCSMCTKCPESANST